MDCVICERCRLWGKIQTLGLGTALKLLIASNDVSKLSSIVAKLRRCEIVALINTLGRLSESISAAYMFESEAAAEAKLSANLSKTQNDSDQQEEKNVEDEPASFPSVPYWAVSAGLFILGMLFISA